MNGKRTPRKNNESGQTLVLLAVFLVGLLGMLALVLDGGNLYLVRRRMQNAADSGALAGARELALVHSQTVAHAKAEEYAISRNGADRASITFEDEGKTIRVTAHKDVPMTFAVIVGIEEVTVSARAAAATFGGIGKNKGDLAPICLYEPSDEIWYLPCCEEGQEPGDPPVCTDDPVLGCSWKFWDDTTEDDNGYIDHEISGDLRGWADPGCAGCYPFDPECYDPVPQCGDIGAVVLAEWMVNGYPGEVSVNTGSGRTWMRGDNGVKNYPVAITQARVGDVLLIAIYDEMETLYVGKGYFRIKRLVSFLVTDVIATGNPKGLAGNIVNHTWSGVIDPNLDGARTFRLIH
jgi:hypothetical protein